MSSSSFSTFFQTACKLSKLMAAKSWIATVAVGSWRVSSLRGEDPITSFSLVKTGTA